MSSQFGTGLDTRDSRLDIAFILGDESIPDNVNWETAARDSSCVWLDFIDIQLSSCKVTEILNKENKNLSNIIIKDNTAITGTLNSTLDKVCSTSLTSGVTVSEISGVTVIPTTDNILANKIVTPTEVVCKTEDITVVDKTEKRNVTTTVSRNKTTRTIKIEDKTIRR